MQIIATFEWNGDKVRLAKPPQGDQVVTVGALREASAALLEWVDGMPVQLNPVKPPRKPKAAPAKEDEAPCQPPAE